MSAHSRNRFTARPAGTAGAAACSLASGMASAAFPAQSTAGPSVTARRVK